MRSGIDATISTERVMHSQFLFASYKRIFELMTEGLGPDAKILEIGSAGGITKNLNERVITTDVRWAPGLDEICSGTNLPFSENTFDAVIIKDALHHISNYQICLSEVYRVLKPGAKFSICEPYWSPLGRVLYSFFHPEQFSLSGINFESFEGHENQALMWFLMKYRQHPTNPLTTRFLFESENLVNGCAWLLSGGATFSTGINDKVLSQINTLEAQRNLWMRIVALNVVTTFHSRKREI